MCLSNLFDAQHLKRIIRNRKFILYVFLIFSVASAVLSTIFEVNLSTTFENYYLQFIAV